MLPLKNVHFCVIIFYDACSVLHPRQSVSLPFTNIDKTKDKARIREPGNYKNENVRVDNLHIN